MFIIMWKALNNFWNRVWNTAAITPRAAWTAITTSADLLNTLYTVNKEAYEILADTSQNIKDVFLWAWNHGKWYHKAMNIPLSPVIAWGTALEWLVRSVVHPIVNWVVNTRNTWENTVKNARRSTFGRIFSKKPISDFSYDHMKTRTSNLKKNRISNWQFGKGKRKAKKETKVEKEIENTEELKTKNKTETKTDKVDTVEIDKKDQQIKELQEKMKIAEKQSKELQEKNAKIIELNQKYEALEKKEKNADKKNKETKTVKMDNSPEKKEKDTKEKAA